MRVGWALSAIAVAAISVPAVAALVEKKPPYFASIAAKGYVVVSVSYRFAAEAPFPAQIKDVKAAIQWLHANAATYHLDPARGAVWGQSAGGHLAALAGVSCGVAAFEPDAAAASGNANVEKITPEGVAGAGQTDCVKAVVSWFGVYRFPAGEPSTSATGGSATIEIDGTTISNLSGPSSVSARKASFSQASNTSSIWRCTKVVVAPRAPVSSTGTWPNRSLT